MRIMIILMTLMIISCNSENEIDETEIMNTVCIDGMKHISVMTKFECYYHSLNIKCGE